MKRRDEFDDMFRVCLCRLNYVVYMGGGRKVQMVRYVFTKNLHTKRGVYCQQIHCYVLLLFLFSLFVYFTVKKKKNYNR